MELLIRPESRGVHYEGYDKEYITCIFEDVGIGGKSERYEFRCRPNLACCGRVCCLPGQAAFPFWLMILFLVLGLILLCAFLAMLAWCCKKARSGPNRSKYAKVSLNRHDVYGTSGAYRSYKNHASREALAADQASVENAYSTPTDNLYNNRDNKMHVYKNPLYTPRGTQNNENNNTYDRAGTYRSTNDRLIATKRDSGPDSGYFRETLEEKFEEKYEMEEKCDTADTDSKENH